MRLKRAEIVNYRSIRQAIIEFGDQTRLIGGNGCGKSSVMRALELFYAPAKTTVSRDDFFCRDETKEIEIALTFHEFSDNEKDMFKGRINESGELRVSRVFSAIGGKNNGRYHGVQLAYPGFQAVRAAAKAAEKLEAYKALLPDHPELEKGARTAAAIEAAMTAWEATNLNRCKPLRDDGQFFGFESVAQGKLSSSTAFVFVPAVRDAAQDVSEGKGTPITLLMDLIVRSAIEARPEIKDFRAKVESEYQMLTDPAKLTELGELANTLSVTLKNFYPDTSVELDWLHRDALKVPLPNAAIRLNDDGFSSAVDRTGHGLQRALIMTLLQHLATASMQGGETKEEKNAPAEPDLILAIEEPEVYQHPTKQRHFARVLDLLSTGKLVGLGKRIQIIYCSHSPVFIAMEQFDQVRLMRRIKKDGQREAIPCSVSLADVAKELDAAHQAKGKFSAEGLRSRLHIIDAGVAEGFFSAVSVLVEGPSDRAALLATARYLDKDLEQNDVAVVSVNGKANIDRPAVIFRGLGIPVYAVWDCDEGAGGEFRPETNKALQRLFKTPEAKIAEATDRVATEYACFRVKLEETLKAEIGADFYRKKLDELKAKYDIARDNDAQKSPVVMFDLIADAAKEGKAPKTLVEIVEAVTALLPVTPK